MREDSTATSNIEINNSTDCKHQMEQIREDPRLCSNPLPACYTEGMPKLLLEEDQPAPHSPALNAKKLSGSLPPLTRHAAYKQERGNATLSLLNVTIRSKNTSLAGKASESKLAEVHCSLADKTGTNFKVEQKTAEHRVAGNLGSVQVTPTAFPLTLPWRELEQ